jgi:hypothetical protein
MGFLGYDDQYLTDYSAFFNQYNMPVEQDTTVWANSGWGSQPIVWEENGDLRNNHGSAGAFTSVTGTVTTGTAGQHVIAPFNVSLASSADIALGKTAWVDGIEVLGSRQFPMDTISGVHLYIENPRVPKGSYSPTTSADNCLIIAASGLTLTDSGNWVLDVNGNAYDTGANPAFADVLGGLPAYSTARKYEVWGYVRDAVPTTGHGVYTVFNIQDSSNLWYSVFEWDGTAYKISLWELNAGSPTGRGGTATLSTTVDQPIRFHFTVIEQGDAVVVSANGYEVDVPTDDDAVSIAYTVASRPFKSSVSKCVFRALGTSNDYFRIQGVKVTDLSV